MITDPAFIGFLYVGTTAFMFTLVFNEATELFLNI